MSQPLFGSADLQLSRLTAPARRFNSVLVDHLEKLTRFQIEAVKRYADLGVEQLRALSSIQDADSLQAYVSSQGQLSSSFGQKLADDANTLSGLHQDLAQELQQLAQENLPFAGNAAAAKAATARKSA